ncbi:MAG TPA: formate/nitrite transporter family protein [Geobacteraceae bacterium]|nr:formate/nitrite transporter family protein [Geobacteraceae bacterium]
MSNFVPPAELSKAFINVGKGKATNTFAKLFVLGILAGCFIGFAAHLATTVATGEWGIFGLQKFFVGAVFSVGLMMVVIPGSELFTGNCLMTIALFNKDISFMQMMRNWLIVYAGNFVGSVALAWMIASGSGLLDGPVGATAINIALGKVIAGGDAHTNMYFWRAIGCNWLVCLAVMMAMAAKDIGGKVLGIFFPIMAFVTSGFEHCVANMYFIPAGIFATGSQKAVELSGKAEALAALNWTTLWTGNLIIVTLGNIVGGAVFTGIVYWWIYVRGTKKAEAAEVEVKPAASAA